MTEFSMRNSATAFREDGPMRRKLAEDALVVIRFALAFRKHVRRLELDAIGVE